MRKCVQCGVEKEDEEFLGIRKSYVITCKGCRERAREYNSQWYRQNKDRVRARDKDWLEQNKGKRNDINKQWKKDNYEKCRGYRIKFNANPAPYAVYARKLTVEESPKIGENGEIIVKCSKCEQYFTPSRREVVARVSSLMGKRPGESRLYCSQKCKDSCEVYGVTHDPYAAHTSIERDSAWAKKIKKLAKYVCERCGATERLEAHHEIPVKIDQTLVKNCNNGICLCHECHMKAHSESGCTLVELRKI